MNFNMIMVRPNGGTAEENYRRKHEPFRMVTL